MTLTFSESTLEQNVSISVIDDVFFEGIEDFDVTLTSSSVRVLIAGVADVTISDNEGNSSSLLSIVSQVLNSVTSITVKNLVNLLFYRSAHCL